MPTTLVKQPAESRLYDMNYKNLMVTAEAIASVTSIVQQLVDPDDGSLSPTSDLTIGPGSFALQIAQARISAGIDGRKYKVTFLVVTDLLNTLEGEGFLKVKNI